MLSVNIYFVLRCLSIFFCILLGSDKEKILEMYKFVCLLHLQINKKYYLLLKDF